jgi:hypothetical protein
VPVGLYAETGLQTLSGQISFGAGVLVVVAGPPTSHSATRWRGTLITAVIVLCSAAVTIAPELPDPVPPIPDTGMG